MKNQYFADKRDFLKYDLLQETAEKLDNVKQLTIIPMLTKPDGTGQGNKRDYQCGKKRNKLFAFLKNCNAEKRLDIMHLRSYFSKWEHEYCPYCDDIYFEHNNRDKYFKEIPSELLSSAVIFLDPDIGLSKESQTNPADREKYIHYSEIADLYNKMEETSVLTVYQHRPQGWSVAKTFETINQRLADRTNISRVLMVSDGQICFFGAAKEIANTRLLAKHWANYSHYQDLSFYC
ncbi:MAG: hypothetical protein ACM3PP_00095 [Candidatus Saccharibacteria bacterium]